MIRFPSKDELQAITNFKSPGSLTIYAPFIDPNSATDPNRIELKNLLKEARLALQAVGVHPSDIQKTLQPARKLISGREFWPVRNQSLVLFMHPEFFRYYRIPFGSAPYLVSVGESFDVRPILQALHNNQPYVVLALSHKNVSLFAGDRDRLRPIRLKDFPTDIKASLGIDEYPQSSESHPIAPSPSNAQKVGRGYHGQYNVSQTDKVMLLQFFRKIDRHLHPYLRRKQCPLIIAGANYLQPIYRQANTYPKLQSGGIGGNLEHLDIDSIRTKAWSLLECKPQYI